MIFIWIYIWNFRYPPRAEVVIGIQNEYCENFCLCRNCFYVYKCSLYYSHETVLHLVNCTFTDSCKFEGAFTVICKF